MNIIFGNLGTITGLPVLTMPQSEIAGRIKDDIAQHPEAYYDAANHPEDQAKWEDGCTWNDVHVHTETYASVSHYSIEATASTCGGGECKKVSYQLLVGDGGILYRPECQTFRMGGGSGITTNTCTGSNCSACSFVYTNGIVTGCSCSDTKGSGTCNHTVTSSQT